MPLSSGPFLSKGNCSQEEPAQPHPSNSSGPGKDDMENSKRAQSFMFGYVLFRRQYIKGKHKNYNRLSLFRALKQGFSNFDVHTASLGILLSGRF